jgi:hypothetical protein
VLDLAGGVGGEGDTEVRHTEGEEEDATPDLLSKNPDATLPTCLKTDETLETCV